MCLVKRGGKKPGQEAVFIAQKQQNIKKKPLIIQRTQLTCNLYHPVNVVKTKSKK